MNYIDYVKASERTVANTPEMRGRITPESMQKLAVALSMAARWGEVLDQLKKEIFYGKEVMEFNPSLTVVNEGALPMGGMGYLQNNINMLHGLLGKVTEAAEIAEVGLTMIQSNTVDIANLLEEIGDNDWYDALIIREIAKATKASAPPTADTYDWAAMLRESILTTNINKLVKRFPNKFEESQALNRDLGGEREILETSHGSTSSISKEPK